MQKKVILVASDKNSKILPLKITIFDSEKCLLSDDKFNKIARKIEVDEGLLSTLPILGIFNINIFLGELADHRPGLNFHYDQVVNGKRTILMEMIRKIRIYRMDNNINGAMPNFYASMRQLPGGDMEYIFFEI